MSKGNRRVKNVTGSPLSSHDKVLSGIDAIDFKRAWMEARLQDSTLPQNPPKNLPEEAQRAITMLARKVLTLESEWS